MHQQLLLPIELIGIVMGYLKDDKASLSACASLSHQWRTVVQPLLFFKITLRCVKRIKRFTKSWDRLKSFHPPVQFTNALILDCCKGSTSYGSGNVTPYDLERVISKFPALRFLTVKNAELFCCPFGRQNLAGWAAPKDLEELRLETVMWDMTDWSEKSEEHKKFTKDILSDCALVQFLNLFGAVESLYLLAVAPMFFLSEKHYTYISEPSSRSAVQAESEKLSSLSVKKLLASEKDIYSEVQPMQVTLDLLRSSHALDTLTCLEIDEYITTSRELLEHIGKNLVHLKMTVSDPFNIDTDEKTKQVCTMSWLMFSLR